MNSTAKLLCLYKQEAVGIELLKLLIEIYMMLKITARLIFGPLGYDLSILFLLLTNIQIIIIIN